MPKKFHDPTQQAEGKAARWKNEPIGERHPDLTMHTLRPFNAEPSNVALQEMITPKGQHYRRTHAPVPVCDDTYRVSISVEGQAAKLFSVPQLKTYPSKELAMTMMCTGNRRGEFNPDGQTAGLPWKNGSISTAHWSGCMLRDLLAEVGVSNIDKAEAAGLNFVTLWGLEKYHVSIPLRKALDNKGDCLLAYDMNGETLPRDHGYPLRAIVPGFVGARSVKWLDRVIVSKEEVKGMHQTGIAYKQMGPNYKSVEDVTAEMVAEYPPIDHIPVTSAVTHPEPGCKVIGGQTIELKGYAYSGAGRAIFRVDISVDNGKTWSQAELTRVSSKQGIRSSRAWAWVQWRAMAKIPTDCGENIKIVCKAVDDQFNQQPHESTSIWNVRGILNTSWGNVNVTVGKASHL